MNQIFSSTELIRLVKQTELEEYGCSEDEFQLELVNSTDILLNIDELIQPFIKDN